MEKIKGYLLSFLGGAIVCGIAFFVCAVRPYNDKQARVNADIAELLQYSKSIKSELGNFNGQLGQLTIYAERSQRGIDDAIRYSKDASEQYKQLGTFFERYNAIMADIGKQLQGFGSSIAGFESKLSVISDTNKQYGDYIAASLGGLKASLELATRNEGINQDNRKSIDALIGDIDEFAKRYGIVIEK